MRFFKIPALTLIVLCATTLLGCASRPDVAPTPSISMGQVLADPQPYQYKAAIWGGTVVSVKNYSDHTDIELVAYSLNKNGLPNAQKQPLGRFIARKNEFLEPANYPVGRLLTVDGSVLGTTAGKVGEADYTYPVLLAHDFKLWAVQDPVSRGIKPNVHFGIGIGSGGRSSVGIGIGL